MFDIFLCHLFLFHLTSLYQYEYQYPLLYVARILVTIPANYSLLDKYIPPPMRNRSTQEPEDDRSPYRGPSSYRSYNNGYGQSNRGDYSDYSSPNRRSYSSYSGPRNSAPRYSGSSRFDVLLTSGSRDYNSYNRDAPVNSLGFHGDTRPSPSLERELFDDSKHVTEGINFDKVPSISRSIHSLVWGHSRRSRWPRHPWAHLRVWSPNRPCFPHEERRIM